MIPFVPPPSFPFPFPPLSFPFSPSFLSPSPLPLPPLLIRHFPHPPPLFLLLLPCYLPLPSLFPSTLISPSFQSPLPGKIYSFPFPSSPFLILSIFVERKSPLSFPLFFLLLPTIYSPLQREGKGKAGK